MAFLQLVKNGSVVFDIGANRGDYTRLFSNIVGRSGMVHAFEPVPPTFSFLRQRIIKECHFQNVSLNNFALGDTTGQFNITVPSGESGQASLKSHAIGAWSKEGRDVFPVAVQTLDDYVSDKQIKRVDFIKIDVEGAELPALRGAQQTLDQFHPTIHLEYCPAWTEAFEYSGKDLIMFLTEHGYHYFYNSDSVALPTPTEDIEAVTESQNVVCSTTPLFLN